MSEIAIFALDSELPSGCPSHFKSFPSASNVESSHMLCKSLFCYAQGKLQMWRFLNRKKKYIYFGWVASKPCLFGTFKLNYAKLLEGKEKCDTNDIYDQGSDLLPSHRKSSWLTFNSSYHVKKHWGETCTTLNAATLLWWDHLDRQMMELFYTE